MRQAKLFSIIVFVMLLVYGVIGFYFLPLATFQGELTRMGLLPESRFGWTKPQPQLDIRRMQQASMREADVLVIGDSFSDSRVWQTVLTRHGLKVRTESWDSMRGICGDFMPWLRAQGFGGKYLVLESIERNLENDLAKSVACEHMQYHANKMTDEPRAPPPVSFDVNAGSYTGKLSTGIKIKLNTMEYEHLSRSPDFSSWQLPNDVRLARVPRGCELFSHASCSDSLFLAYDKAEDISDSALENIGKVGSRLNGVATVWMFVPNKSTAYLYPDKQFWDKAERRFRAPNLLRVARQAIEAGTVDLYPANNTHFSTSGYLLMGEEVFKALQATQPR